MGRALLIVDIQNDFLPGGALAVKEGDGVIPVINALALLPFDLIVASKDWHPANHMSFAANHGLPIGSTIKLDGIDQILWPTHCVQNAFGAQFPPSLETDVIGEIVYKGTNPAIDSYSAFFDNRRLHSTGMLELLRSYRINQLVIAGLATDYCVKYSAIDALDLGFRVTVVTDGCRAVNLAPTDGEEAFSQMEKAGAELVTLHALQKREDDDSNSGR